MVMILFFSLHLFVSNEIGVRGVEALASYLIQRDNSLECLLLSYNLATDEGAKAMAEVRLTNGMLQYIHMYSVVMSLFDDV